MAEEYKKPAYDSWKLGVSLGIIAPIATFLSYYFYSSRRIPFARFVDNLRLG